MTIANPIRYPNSGSRDVMTRRGWWLVALNFLMPGSAQVLDTPLAALSFQTRSRARVV